MLKTNNKIFKKAKRKSPSSNIYRMYPYRFQCIHIYKSCRKKE